MTQIEGDSHVSKQYRQECSQGVKLFQETLKAYQSSDIAAQKEKYKDVMGKALQIIHETATRCLSEELQKEEINLEKDYKNFIANPSQANLDKLSSDLNHFQKGV